MLHYGDLAVTAEDIAFLLQLVRESLEQIAASQEGEHVTEEGTC